MLRLMNCFYLCSVAWLNKVQDVRYNEMSKYANESRELNGMNGALRVSFTNKVYTI